MHRRAGKRPCASQRPGKGASGLATPAALVIGGGIIGTSVSLGLQERGWHVTLYDRGRVGAESTAGAAGVVSELTWDEQDRLWVAESRERYRRPPGGRTDIFRRTGSLAFACGDDAQRLVAHAERLSRVGVNAMVLSPADLMRRYPGLRLESDGQALLLAEDGVTNASVYAQEAARRLTALGGEVHEDSPVTVVLDEGSGPAVLLPDGSRRTADAIVAATGAWTARILHSAALWAPVRPYRTHLAAVRHPGTADLPDTVFHDVALDWYWVPEGPGRILAGDGTEHVESDPDTFRRAPDAWFLEQIAQRLARRTTGGAEAEIGRAYAGILTATPDRRPLLGRVPGTDRLWIAAGMNGFGVMRGPAIGHAVARAVAGDALALPASCRPDRVPWERPTFPILPGYTL